MEHRVLAVALALSCAAAGAVEPAAPSTATVVGHVLSLADRAPLVGARIRLSRPDAAPAFRSEPTAVDGRFRLGDVPPAAYDVSVEREGSLYVVDAPIRLGPGETVAIDLAVRPAPAPAPAASSDRPALRGLLIAGTAIVAGVIVNEIVSDDDIPTVSPSGRD